MIVVNASRCPQNHRCPTLRVCPTGALQQEGFNAPFIDHELCIDCGKCTYSCPVFTQVREGAPHVGNGHPKNGSAAESQGLGGILRRFQRDD
jgi:Fe-S-cluster-containing hydrogenase component 2